MDYIPSDMLRGHLDTIILLSLVDNDKHTNQIKEVIEKRSGGQFVLKQGTFYSCLQRITKQGYVTEYRTTDEDGVRRKFFQLTEKGKTYIDGNKDNWTFSKHILDLLIAPIDKTEEKKEQPVDSLITEEPAAQNNETPFVQEKPAEEELKNFLDHRIDEEPSDNLSNKDLSYIDFTQAETVFTATKNDRTKQIKKAEGFEQLSIAEPEYKQDATKQETFNNKPSTITEEQKTNETTPVKSEDILKDAYSEQDGNFNNETTDYKSVLEKIFGEPSSVSNTTREMKYEDGVDVNEFFNDKKQDKTQRQLKIPEQKKTKAENVYESNFEQEKETSFYDFTDVLDLANEEGFKIRISSKESKKDVGKILINKLNMFSSLVFFGILLLETILIGLLTSAVAELDSAPYIIFVAICSLFPIVNTVIFFISPQKRVRNIPSFKNSIELILIVCLNLLLIDVVCCVLGAVDFSSYKELTRFLFYPILFVINLPAYYIIKYTALQKNAFYD